MISKIDILLALNRRAKTAKGAPVPIISIQDDVMMSDSMFVDMVLQLDKNGLVKIHSEDPKWYTNFSEIRDKIFITLTSSGKQKVLAHNKK